MARAVVEQLRDFGRARRGWLGVMIQQMTPEIAESLGMKETTGVMVAGVTDGGPAAAAKLRGGDVILKFNGQEIKDRALPRVVAEAAIGKQVPVVIWRDGKEVTVSVAVGEMPDDVKLAVAQAGKPAPAAELSTLGMKLSVITPEAAKRFSLKDGQKGVLITDLAQGAPGAEKGLKPGDVIVEVQQEVVSTPADVVDRVEKLRKAGRKSALMLVQTQDGVHWVPVPLADKPGRAPG
jgi:serine protease Do